VSENIKSILSALPAERRAEIENRAKELAMDEDFRRAAGILEKSQALEDGKFYTELGWLTALSIAIAVIAV
jgi:hypothetical protein